MPATMRSGHAVCDAHTPLAAIMTATFPIGKVRVRVEAGADGRALKDVSHEGARWPYRAEIERLLSVSGQELGTFDADTPKEGVWEAADVIYFALVAALQRGASLAEIEAMLDARTRKVTRRPGNAKPNKVSGGSR